MSSKIRKDKKFRKEMGGEMCYVDPKTGKASDKALHDEIAEGVDVTELVKDIREDLKNVLTPKELDAIFPLK